MMASGSCWDDDPDLALLRFDSALGLAPGPGAARRLTFVAHHLTVDVEIDAEGVRGRLTPPQPAGVALVGPGAPPSGTADAEGRFALAPCAGPARLRVSPAGGPVIVTDPFDPAG